jgi:hypothetical protein
MLLVLPLLFLFTGLPTSFAGCFRVLERWPGAREERRPMIEVQLATGPVMPKVQLAGADVTQGDADAVGRRPVERGGRMRSLLPA